MTPSGSPAVMAVSSLAMEKVLVRTEEASLASVRRGVVVCQRVCRQNQRKGCPGLVVCPMKIAHLGSVRLQGSPLELGTVYEGCRCHPEDELAGALAWRCPGPISRPAGSK